VHFEDQLAAVKNAATWAARCWCRREAVQKLIAADWRRTSPACDPAACAHRRGSGNLVTSDIDENDRPFSPGAHGGRLLPRQERHRAGHCARIAYAEYADMVWCETGTPVVEEIFWGNFSRMALKIFWQSQDRRASRTNPVGVFRGRCRAQWPVDAVLTR